MAKIARKNQLIFGNSAGFHEIGKFGSLAAGLPAWSTDPEVIQSLSNYLSGWFGAVVGGNSPAIEDMNALCFLFAYQLCYLFQEGIPEWNTSAIYFKGSFVNSGGFLYVSLTDNNTGNAVTNTTNWKPYLAGARTRTTTDTALATDDYVRLDPTGGSFVFTLQPVASVPVGTIITVKNISSGANTATVKGNASENIDFANTVVLNSTDSVKLYNNGTSWDVI